MNKYPETHVKSSIYDQIMKQHISNNPIVAAVAKRIVELNADYADAEMAVEDKIAEWGNVADSVTANMLREFVKWFAGMER